MRVCEEKAQSSDITPGHPEPKSLSEQFARVKKEDGRESGKRHPFGAPNEECHPVGKV